MSTLIEHSVYEKVLYRGKSKQKWEQRIVSVKRSGCNGKYLVKFLPTQRRPILWRRKKLETVELTPNSHAVIHMDTLGNQRNVVGLLQVRRGSQISGHFFTSEDGDVLSNLKAVLAKCCDVVSFEVDSDATLKSSTSTKAQLHIFHDRICLSTNLGYEFKLLGEWQIDSLTRLLTAHGGVTLIMTNEAQQENTLILRTERGIDICSKLSERHRCLAPASHQQLLFQSSNSAVGVTQCDDNSNIMSASRLHVSKSCDEIMNQLHFEPLSSKANSLPLRNKVKPSLDSRDLSSLSRLPSYLEAKSPLSSEGSICKDEDVHNFTDSCSSTSSEPSSSSDNDIIAVPPPVPQRQLKPNPAKAELTEQVKDVLICADKYSKSNYSNVEDLIIQRSRSFQIVDQPLSGRKKQRYKSDSSLVTKTVITELVRPICVDFPSANSGNPCGSYMYLQENSPAVNTCTELSNGACSPKQDEENACSPPISESGFEAFGHRPSTTRSRASTHPHFMLTSINSDVPFVDEENQVKEEGHSSDSTCHYVNLPEGSRPSCYLYMNLPDSQKAPKEAANYVNHVFMSRSMKGMYENVQQFYNEKFETAVSSEERTSAPPLPPPTIQPRRPPPRVPRRISKDPQASHQSPARLPVHMRGPLGPPCPPRPPKKEVTVSKEIVPNTQQDIQVQIAVFASKAVAGRVWFLRIVVMKHDPDDFTFKTVKDREIASKYHLKQTYPFSISSDIVVSLKHQCQQFKLTSEDHQEVGYNIIENLVHGFWFVIEFHLEHMGNDTEPFVGIVCVEPKDLPAGEKCPVNKTFNLGITEDFELKQPCNCEQHGNHHHANGNQACKLVIPDYAKRKEICEKLDITMYSKYNWRDVAGHAQLGFQLDEIKSIEDKAQRCPNFSPMEHILTTWEQRDPGCSLDRLVSILRDIQRLDVVNDLGFSVDLESS